jgi:hypothetical protein
LAVLGLADRLLDPADFFLLLEDDERVFEPTLEEDVFSDCLADCLVFETRFFGPGIIISSG